MSAVPMDGEAGRTPATRKVLVVEDDFTSREYLRAVLRKNGWTVEMADCMAAAQTVLTNRGCDALDCVATDYRMPGGSGLDLLAWLRREDPSLATVILTAEGEKQLIAESLRGGASDFLEKPVDVGRLLSALDGAARRTLRQRQARDVESAAQGLGRTQLGMLRNSSGGGRVEVELCFHPKQAAGGDFFTQFQPSPNLLCCLLTDVSGHDLEAAYMSAYFQGVVRGMLRRSASLPDVFAFYNQLLLDEWNGVSDAGKVRTTAGTSVAVCSVMMDFRHGRAGILNCGAPAPVYVEPDGTAREVGPHGGSPLGWFQDAPVAEVIRPIAAGGEFLMWTDGLDDLAERHAVSPLSLGFALGQARQAGTRLPHLEAASDDILFARVRLAGWSPGKPRFQPVVLERYHGGQLGEIDVLEAQWARSLRLALPGLSESIEYDILLATREAVLNALGHGCQHDPERSAWLQISVDPGGGRLRVRADDPGSGHSFDYLAHAEAAAEQLLPDHRGLALMHHLAGELHFERGGASVIMHFEVPGSFKGAGSLSTTQDDATRGAASPDRTLHV